MDALPPEVVQGVLVASGDGHHVATSCALVCRQWAALTGDPALWKALALRFLSTACELEPSRAEMEAVGGRWKEAYFALARRTRQATVALMGQAQCGKSALFDLLCALSPLADDPSADDPLRSETAQAIARHAKGEDEPMSLQRKPARGTRCGELVLTESRCRLTLVDLPPCRDVKNFWAGLVGAHCGILVVPSTEQLESAFMAGIVAGVQHLVVAINMMNLSHDLSAKSRERMDEIVSALMRRLAIAGYASSNVQYVPISASQGVNVVRRDPKTEFPWYSGPTLLAALERVVSSVPSISSVRLRWDLAIVVGTVMSGKVCVGDKLAIAPLGVEAVTVEQIQQNRRDQPVAYGPCARVGLLVSFDPQLSFPGSVGLAAEHIAWFKRRYMKRGVVMGRMGELEATRQVSSFEAKMVVVQLNGQIRSGYGSTIRCCTADASCRWELLTKFVQRGEAAVVKLTPQWPLYLEPHCRHGHLGRVVNYENGIVTAFGIVKKVNWLEPAAPLYLRVKRNQPKTVKRGTITVTVLDGYIESSCPWTPDAAIVNVELVARARRERRTTNAELNTCRPAWRQSFTFECVSVNQAQLVLSMEDTASGREYGEDTRLALSALGGTCNSLRRRVTMANIYNLNNYVNIDVQYQGD